MRRHVIIGNSHAAISAVQALRSVNSADEVCLVSREACPAYSPMLTPYYLSGRIPYEGMFFCDEAFYQDNGVDTILGKAVARVSPGSRTVTLDDGTAVPYDTLLRATGSTSWVPPIPGVESPGVFTLWTAGDAQRISDALSGAERIAVVGAGLIGMDCVNAALERGKRVTLIEMQGQVMPQALDAVGARIIEARMRDHGVQLHLNDQVLGIEAGRGRLSLSLASGSRVEAEVAVIATGVTPNVALLEGSGVEVAAGVLVNEHCETNVPGVYAAGDVAQSADGVTGQRRVNATIVNAAEQGRVAGLNMAGVRAPRLKRVQVNAFASLGLPCVSMGLISPAHERGREVTQRSGERYRKLVLEGDRLLGAVLIGDVDDAGVLASLIEGHERFPTLVPAWERGHVPLPYAMAMAGGAGHWA